MAGDDTGIYERSTQAGKREIDKYRDIFSKGMFYDTIKTGVTACLFYRGNYGRINSYNFIYPDCPVGVRRAGSVYTDAVHPFFSALKKPGRSMGLHENHNL